MKFKDFFDIPVALLKSVALCFRDKMTVCRKCFYGERNLNKRRAEAKFCNFGEHEWIKPILVIPGTQYNYHVHNRNYIRFGHFILLFHIYLNTKIKIWCGNSPTSVSEKFIRHTI